MFDHVRSLLRPGTSRLAGLAVFVALVIGATGPAAAAQKQAEKPKIDELPKALQSAVKSGQIEVIRSFSTDVPGLTGFVMAQSGQHQIVYGDHGYLIVGRVVSPEGEDLSARYADRYVPKPDLAKIVDALEKTDHLVSQGPASAPTIYAFADPNCIYCHKLAEQAAPLVKAGKLRIQWALVGFLKETSAGRAAAILGAKDPAKAFARNEAGFDEASEAGGIAPVKSIDPKIQTVLDAHTQQMAAAGGNGTPTLIYKNETGEWASKIGAPGRDWLEQFIQARTR